MKRALQTCRELCDAAGFDPALVDDSLLEAAIRRRIVASGEPDLPTWYGRLSTASDEQEALLEELLVRESWFFRDSAPFTMLGALLRQRWPGLASQGVLRVLSAPCAGGEEPYSIAMALAADGFAPADYRIDAVDLSRRGLESAARARYQSRVLRHVPVALAEMFLQPVADGRVEVHAALRGTVRLHRANLLDLPPAVRDSRYHVIFSRNVLIYLGPSARNRLLSQLEQLLLPDGLLVVGHAEAGLLAERGFVSVGGAATFTFARSGSSPPEARSPRKAAEPIPRAARKRVSAYTQRSIHPAHEPRGASAAAKPAAQLERIRTLADKGAYPEAAQQIEALIGADPACVDAHYLLGLIRSAEGRGIEARQAFERTTYLDPTHGPALQHLALLLEASGEHSAASRLRRRASKAGGSPV